MPVTTETSLAKRPPPRVDSVENGRNSLSFGVDSPALSIGVVELHKRLHCGPQPSNAGSIERQYSAATAKSHLIQSGLEIPLPRKKMPRVLPPDSGVDMTTVEVVCSSKFTDSSPCSTAVSHDACYETMMSSLMQSTQSFYKALPPPPPEYQKQDPWGSTSSVTNTESTDLSQEEEEIDKSAVFGRGERRHPSTFSSSQEEESSIDGTRKDKLAGGNSGSSSDSKDSSGSSSDSKDESRPSSDNTESLYQKQKEKVDRSTETGTFSSDNKQARLITLGQDPFIIVFVDDAFTRLTGFSFLRVQGRPLREFLEDESPLHVLKESGETLTGTIIPKHQFNIKSYTKKKKFVACKIRVSPIGPPLQSASHLQLDLKPLEDSVPWQEHFLKKEPGGDRKVQVVG